MKKISELSPQSKKILAAELDGYVDIGFHKPQGFMFKCLSGKIGSDEKANFIGHVPLKEYDKSRDVIVLLVQKQFAGSLSGMTAFFNCLKKILGLEQVEMFEPEVFYFLFTAPVDKILDALLVASGKAEI